MDFIEINLRIARAKQDAYYTEWSDGRGDKYNKALDKLVEDIEAADDKELSDYAAQKIAEARTQIS